MRVNTGFEVKLTGRAQRHRQAREVVDRKLPVGKLVRGRPEAVEVSYKSQMVEFERCVGPWVEETFAGVLIVRGIAYERDFTDN